MTNVYNNVYTAFSYFVILENFLLGRDIEGLEPTSPDTLPVFYSLKLSP